MTNEQLDAIEARANAATPGAWGFTHAREGISGFDDGRLLWGACAADGSVSEISEWFGDVSDVGAANAEFIAQARTDVPALVAEVRRLRAVMNGYLRGLETPAAFIAYVEQNYPPGVRITNPTWHAPKLWRAAARAMADAQVSE